MAHDDHGGDHGNHGHGDGHDDHGHGDGHGNHGSAKGSSEDAGGSVSIAIPKFITSLPETLFLLLFTWVSDTITRFIFVLFFIIGIGAFYGVYLAPVLASRVGGPALLWVSAPFILGVVAMESRDWAFVLLLAIIALVILL
jgi:hypothetical protein